MRFFSDVGRQRRLGSVRTRNGRGGGREEVRLTNPGRVMYPDIGVTKGRVIEYYAEAAPRMIGMIRGRALALKRFPDGIGGGGFFEQNAPIKVPPWVRTFRRRSGGAGGSTNHLVGDSLDTLIWIANLSAVEIHISLSRVESYERPDLILFDLDPEAPAGVDEAVDAALLLRERLGSAGVEAYVKTSGKRGLHVVVPVVPAYTFGQTREFVRRIGAEAAKEGQGKIALDIASRGPGKVFIDYPQNSQGRVTICPYSLRATPGATVSAPISWEEVRRGLDPGRYNIFTVAAGGGGAPWGRIFEEGQRI